MSRFFVTSTVVGLITISGLAFILIAIVIARSPYTHGNLTPQGYDRTEIGFVGQEADFEGLGLADPKLASSGDPIQDGRVLFFRYGCTSCHGLNAQGGIVGEELDDVSPSEIRRKLRKGPEGMPAYTSSLLSEEDLEKLVAFLTADPSEVSSAGAEEERTASDESRMEPNREGLWEQIVSYLR